MESLLISDLQRDIADIKADTERLRNPEPPPLVQIKTELPGEVFKPTIGSAAVPSLIHSHSHLSAAAALDDDTTRMSGATDSRSLCGGGVGGLDVKSESGQFGWNDDWSEEEGDEEEDEEEEETSSSMAARLGLISSNFGGPQKAESKLIKEEQEDEEHEVVVKSSRGFDIESEILPNFILNMKKNAADHHPEGDNSYKKQRPLSVDLRKDSFAKLRVESAVSPAGSVKSEGYDEWTSIQKELANMGAVPAVDPMEAVKQEKATPFDDFDKLKQPWMGGINTNTTTAPTATESNANVHVNASVRLGEGGTSLPLSSKSAAVISAGSHFYSLETSNQSVAESWLDFQHNNNSFDFPISAPTGSSSSGGGGGQLLNGGHSGGSVSVSQKRVWNGIAEGGGNGNSNGAMATGGGMLNGGGGVDDFYAKKMCYGNGDFDFNHLMMGGSHQAQHQQPQSSFHGSNNGASTGMEPHLQQQQQQQHHQQQSHSQTFDEDINRQVQSAIDSILNLQGSDASDFHFNLDPAMGALLGGGDSSSGGHHALDPQGSSMGGGAPHPHHHHHHQHTLLNHGDGIASSRNSTSSPLSLMPSRFSSAGHHQQMPMTQPQQQQHVNSQHREHHQSSLGSAMILSEEDEEEDEEDEDDDEQQRAIKSVLLS